MVAYEDTLLGVCRYGVIEDGYRQDRTTRPARHTSVSMTKAREAERLFEGGMDGLLSGLGLDKGKERKRKGLKKQVSSSS